jgi:biopolymer transport protein ExbB
MDRRRRRIVVELAIIAALLPATAAYCSARDEKPAAAVKSIAAKSGSKTAAKSGSDSSKSAAKVGRGDIVAILTQANPLLWPLGICSIVTLGFALERLVALRRERIVPKDFVNRFIERLAGGKLDRERATELCRANESPAARVFGQVVRYWGQPSAAIRQAIDHDIGVEIADLKRNVRVLNGAATLAPLLGLLGTVIGIIESFEALGGKVGAARGSALAHGISLALVTTAFGLAIAIVSVIMYYFLLGRLDLAARELDRQTLRVIDLVAAESARPAVERRPGMSPGDHARHETRAI